MSLLELNRPSKYDKKRKPVSKTDSPDTRSRKSKFTKGGSTEDGSTDDHRKNMYLPKGKVTKPKYATIAAKNYPKDSSSQVDLQMVKRTQGNDSTFTIRPGNKTTLTNRSINTGKTSHFSQLSGVGSLLMLRENVKKERGGCLEDFEVQTETGHICCIVSGTTAIVFLMAIVYGLITLAFFVEPLPKLTPAVRRTTRTTTKIPTTTELPTQAVVTHITVPVVNLTRHCLESLHSRCHFYEKKYIEDCSKMSCQSIGYTISSHNASVGDGVMLSQATFTPFDQSPSFPVPDNAPCREGTQLGRCISGKCRLSDLSLDQPLTDYVSLAPQNGSYDTEGWAIQYNRENCIDIRPQTVEMFAPMLQGECAKKREPHACQEFEVLLRRCWAPLPAMGGVACPDSRLPVAFGQPCLTGICSSEKLRILPRKHEFPAIDCLDQMNWDLGCAYVVYKGRFSPDDFQPCCSSDFNGPGMCIAGRCVQKRPT